MFVEDLITLGREKALPAGEGAVDDAADDDRECLCCLPFVLVLADIPLICRIMEYRLREPCEGCCPAPYKARYKEADLFMRASHSSSSA